MKRVILIRSNSVNPDPPVEKVAAALLNAGYFVSIIGWDRDRDYTASGEFLQLGNYQAEIVRIGIKAQFGGGIKKNLLPLFLFQKRLLCWLIKNKAAYDIIHAFDFDTGFVASKCAQRFGKQFIYHILDYYVDSHMLRGTIFEKAVLKLENSVIQFADVTVICTEKRKEQISGSAPKRLVVIHNTPSSTQMQECEKKTKQMGRIKIVYVGILQPGRLLKEVTEAVSENDGIELHIGGFGSYEEFFEDIANRCDNIFYYGRLTYQQTLALENECDIMLAIYDPAVENHRYAAPNKFYESLMLGKPVIMVRGTGMSEIVEENGIGALIDYSKEGFCAGISQLIADRARWHSMESRMKAIYRQQYCWDEMERRLIQIYAELQKEDINCQ